MKYAEIIKRLEQAEAKSKKGIAKVLKELFPDCDVSESWNAFQVVVYYKEGEKRAEAFSVQGHREYYGLSFEVSNTEPHWRYVYGVGHVLRWDDTDADFTRCHRVIALSRERESDPFEYDTWGVKANAIGTKRFIQLKNHLLSSLHYQRERLARADLPYEVTHMLDKLKRMADSYSSDYNPSAFWREIGKAKEEAEKIVAEHNKDLSRYVDEARSKVDAFMAQCKTEKAF